MSVLGSDNVTANGNVTIPEGCVYVVALCVGTTDPPYLNGNIMQTYASVPETGILKAIGIHTRAFPTVAIIPFVMNGADKITFVYLDDAVCTRADVYKGYDKTTGSMSGNLLTSTNDLVLGMILGSNGQVTIKGDGTDFTLLYDTTTCRIGHITPGDNSLTCDVADSATPTGYWYQPPAVWVDTSTSVLVEPGHYEFNPVYHNYWWVNAGGNYWDEYQYNAPGDPAYTPGTSLVQSHVYSTTQPKSGSFYTYPATWVPDRYETQSSGYWSYPPQQWIQTSAPGEISCAFISIADTMIGGIYVSRPLIC